jgi:hypothetical protein
MEEEEEDEPMKRDREGEDIVEDEPQAKKVK